MVEKNEGSSSRKSEILDEGRNAVLLDLLGFDEHEAGLRRQLETSLTTLAQKETELQVAQNEYREARKPVDTTMRQEVNEYWGTPSDDFHPPLIRTDPELLEKYRFARARYDALCDEQKRSKNNILSLLLEANHVSEFGRAAFIQALYYAEPAERTMYAQEFKLALERLNEDLFEGQVFYQHNSDTAGFYKVSKPGIVIDISKENVRPPCVVVRTHHVVGSEVTETPTFLNVTNNVEASDEGVILYSVSSDTLRQPQDPSLLNGEVYLPTRQEGPQFLVGEKALASLEPTVHSHAKLIALAIAASQQGISPESINLIERCQFTQEIFNELVDMVIIEIAEALMGKKVDDGEINIPTRIMKQQFKGNVLELKLKINTDDLETMRILASLCGLTQETGFNALMNYANGLSRKARESMKSSSVSWSQIDFLRERIDHNRKPPCVDIFPPHN